MSLSSLAARDVARAAGPSALKAADARSPAADDRFEVLTRYIPTETITLFVAAMSVQTMMVELWSPLGPWVLYWTFAALTPVIQLLLTYLKQREAEADAAQPKAAFRPHPWPVAAALIAFLVWALSVIVQPLENADAFRAVAAVGALFISTVLSVGDRIAKLT